MSTIINNQYFLFDLDLPPVQENKRRARTGAFTDNMKLPIHRWFRYSAGFSAEWVEKMLISEMLQNETVFFDPFAGSGTSLLVAEKLGLKGFGLETHPFVLRIAKIKLLWDANQHDFLSAVSDLIEKAQKIEKDISPSDVPLLNKCFTQDTFQHLEALRLSFQDSFSPGETIADLVWLALTSILRDCSGVGTAQWQYILPNKSKSRVLEPFSALMNKAYLMVHDMQYAMDNGFQKTALIINDDARFISTVDNQSIDIVITSPPYPNNYDYADATRLEMTFWRDITSWGDLHEAVRMYLIRSCSQHSAKDRLCLDDLLDDPAIEPIRDELSEVCKTLETIRHEKGGKKTYHTMIAAYFIDLAHTWISLRRLCKDNSKLCFVIGDSAPYGVYIPVDEWLGKLALSVGFKHYKFEKIRDRNIKWKNRKHRIPLKEGNLWVSG